MSKTLSARVTPHLLSNRLTESQLIIFLIRSHLSLFSVRPARSALPLAMDDNAG